MTPKEESVLQQHLDTGEYLPKELRDFHDQKDLFKAIGDRDVRVHNFLPPEIINWCQGQVYTIDHFLYFMAIHGYELRKVKGKVPRYDLQETIESNRKARLEALRPIIEGKV